MALEKPRIKMPERAAVGDIIEIRALISHIMENGQRRDPKTHQFVPRMILNTVVAKFEGINVVLLVLGDCRSGSG